MWIARDENGNLWVYENKPIRKSHTFHPLEMEETWTIINKDQYPEVTWENSPKELVVKEEESV